ncbi:MAG: putative LPS assembly protein LptD, partial [Bacteroidales bacterium]|nr:putative LPS assembly protein LptD [Bacteroidales bacterium]
VDFSTNKFDQLHNYTNTTQLMTNTKRSSIAYSKNWTNKPFHLTLNANHSQSSGSDQMTIMFPSLNFTVDRFYPFRPKNISGETKWYQDIQLSYSAQMQNTLKGKETKLFSDSAIHHMVNGFKHTIPISMNIKLLKQINITPTMNYTGVMYLNHQEKRFDETYVNSDGTFGKVVTDTIQGISYAHGVTPNLSISYAPKLYVIAQAKNPLATLQKVRNVITTSVGFSYVPDVSSIMPDYYRTLEYDQVDSEGVTQHFTEKYSIYDGYLYGTPTLPGKSGSFSFSLRDNIEAKIRPRAFRKDTIPTEESELKKIKLLENIAFNASYNPFADSMKLSNISFSGNNTFMDDKLNITFNGTFSPYALDEKGRAYNQLLIKNGGFLRLTSFSLSPTFRIDGTMGKKDESESEDLSPEDASTPRETLAEQAPVNPAMQGGVLPYDYFSIPWSLSASYDFTYSKQSNTANILQTLRLNGDFSLTPKWKIAFSTGYDVESKQVTHTSLTIDRDLHCWVMSLNISPFGEYKYYGFQINVKSSMLSDLKYRKNKSQYDNVSF